MSLITADLGTIAVVAVGTTHLNIINPFYNGTEALVVVDLDAFVGTYKVQSSVDGTIWTDDKSEVIASASDKSVKVAITDLAINIRINVTVRTGGSITGTLMG